MSLELVSRVLYATCLLSPSAPLLRLKTPGEGSLRQEKLTNHARDSLNVIQISEFSCNEFRGFRGQNSLED